MLPRVISAHVAASSTLRLPCLQSSPPPWSSPSSLPPQIHNRMHLSLISSPSAGGRSCAVAPMTSTALDAPGRTRSSSTLWSRTWASHGSSPTSTPEWSRTWTSHGSSPTSTPTWVPWGKKTPKFAFSRCNKRAQSHVFLITNPCFSDYLVILIYYHIATFLFLN
jgi:hypothetical protein